MNRSLPIKLEGFTRMKSVVAGPWHGLALHEDGTLWGWGDNTYGRAGQPESTYFVPTPAQMPGLTGVVDVAAGSGHNLVLRTDGTVWAWGENAYGQLGSGTELPHATPAQVPGLTDVVDVAARGEYSLALREDGTVWAWGLNYYGQLGRPENHEANPTPMQVPELSGVVALAAGEYHVLALREDGTVWAWGENNQGQLGQPASHDASLGPSKVEGLTKVVGLAAGTEFSLALRQDGTVWAWGANGDGQLGDGTRTARHTPQQVEGLKQVISLAADRHPLAMTRNGTVWGWGGNSSGQLGTGTDVRTTPVQVLGLSQVRTVSVGSDHVLSLRADGTVWAWGFNWRGQLGDGTQLQRAAPVQVQNLSEVVALAAGATHSLGLRADGTVWGWGNNVFGQLGRPANYTPNPTPAQVPGLTGVVAVKASGYLSLALREDGTVWAWGYNSNGQLGRPANYTPNPTPAQVPGLTDVVALAGSDYYVLALRADGTVWGWGSNSNGQLGRPAHYTPNPTPAQVPGLTGVVALATASQHVLALREDGTVWAWGANWQGQLGDGTRQHRYTPAPVPGLTDVTGITALLGSSLVVRQDGTVWGFGFNHSGLLTPTEQFFHLSPVQRPELSGVTALFSKSYPLALALREDGTLLAWGSNVFDQIGDGVSSVHTTPARVRLPCRFTAMTSRDHRASEAEGCPAMP